MRNRCKPVSAVAVFHLTIHQALTIIFSVPLNNLKQLRYCFSLQYVLIAN